mgnify:CR=1 FL=1
MFFITFKRILKSGYLNFRRNAWLSAATILVLTVVLIVLGLTVFLSAIAHTVLGELQSKIDVSIYFNPAATEEEIIAVKRELEKLPDVAGVSYMSRDAALAEFRERHKDNALIVGALEELGENPLEAVLNVKAHNPAHYASISDFLVKRNYPIVEKVNYFENEEVIQRLSSILASVRGVSAGVTIFLAFVAVLVAFNTLRLAIYTVREEIGIMRLVGAAAWFIRGPFVVSGILYGIAAGTFTIAFFFPLTRVVAPQLALLVPKFNLFQYFLGNIGEFSALMLGGGVVLGGLSSVIAIRRYLQV